MKKKKGKNETDLHQYKKVGKTLKPPLAQLNMANSSWIDSRLPELLWEILVIDSLPREKALEFFRYCLSYIGKDETISDITLSGISSFPEDKRLNFLNHIISYPLYDISDVLKPMLVFLHLPAFSSWKEVLKNGLDDEISWTRIASALRSTLSHQSQEATDCRWFKIAAMVVTDKMRMSEKMGREIIFYPNEGEAGAVRAMIRAAEIAPQFTVESTWPGTFWKESFERTGCHPEQALNHSLREKHKQIKDELEAIRKDLSDQTAEIRKQIIGHFFDTVSTSTIDARHEAVFGITLYGFGTFIENIFFRTAVAVNGRIMLRILFEAYVTLAYLLSKEVSDANIWKIYRDYGNGQANLIYRKYEENAFNSSTVDKVAIERIANEDKWVEFVPIDLGHWDATDLRKICEGIGEKEMYDKYYSYTSGFVHANWAAIRESQFQSCLNPLHRLHRIPDYGFPLMTSVTPDMIELVNKLLSLLSQAYPTFDARIIVSKTTTSDSKSDV